MAPRLKNIIAAPSTFSQMETICPRHVIYAVQLSWTIFVLFTDHAKNRVVFLGKAY